MELKKLYEIYTDADDDSCDVGFVIAQDDENTIFQSITPSGYCDGIILYKTTDIFKLAGDTSYLECMTGLINHNKIIFEEYSFKSDNLAMELLQFIKNQKEIVSVVVRHSDENRSLGLLTGLDGDFFEVSEINWGDAEGKSRARISDISSIHYNSFYDRKHKILYDMKANK